MLNEPDKKRRVTRNWTRRVGLVASLFFLAKGLVWLGLLAAGAYYSLSN